jgi:hypothetical protein
MEWRGKGKRVQQGGDGGTEKRREERKKQVPHPQKPRIRDDRVHVVMVWVEVCLADRLGRRSLQWKDNGFAL